MAMHSPPHPGTFLRDEILEANDLSVSAAAELLKVARPTLSKLLNGRADLSAEMALRFEQVFGLQMSTLLSMQIAHDEALVRRTRAKLRLKPFRVAATSPSSLPTTRRTAS